MEKYKLPLIIFKVIAVGLLWFRAYQISPAGVSLELFALTLAGMLLLVDIMLYVKARQKEK